MQPMRDLLRGNLARSLRTMPQEDRLAAAWPVACGRAMAAHGSIVGYDGSVVRIEVQSQVWIEQMISLRGVLERDLARIAGVRVNAIHFEVKKG